MYIDKTICIQVFQSDPLPQVYQIKYQAMPSALQTFVCVCVWGGGGGGGRSEEHSKFKHGTVIGCPLCNKSVCEIYFLLDIPQSTISGIIEKYKYLGTAAMKQKTM